ncbi:MAG TPA: DUF3108 domain-containing protein [Azospirillum sp.]|nr:DUF3108 domain-containing protein [Azospirillum sp.]
MQVCTFVVGALVLTLSGTAYAERWELAFEAYGGGLPLAQGVLHLTTDGPGRRYEAQLDTAGASWISLFAKFRYEAQSAGALKNPAVTPERFRGERNTRSKREIMTLAYDGAAVTVQTEPPLSPEKAALVPDDAKRGSVDPLSAGIAVVVGAGGRSACTGSYPVFDGRRRYDILAKPLGSQVLEPSRRRIAAGPAQRCSVALRPVAGFQTDRDKPNAFFVEGKERTATIWFMPVQGRTIPMQVEVETDFGSFYVHTTGFKVLP